MREGNNILGVYACNPDKPPIAIRYLVDPAAPGAEITVDISGKKYTVRYSNYVESVPAVINVYRLSSTTISFHFISCTHFISFNFIYLKQQRAVD